MPSKVYFLNDRAGTGADSIPFKGVQTLRDAGLRAMVKPGDKVAIKTHLGEWGNALNLRPQWLGAIVSEVKRLGGKPAIVETCVAVYGENVSRFTKENYLRTAAYHGYTEETVGCPIVICDGDYGTDDVKVEVKNGIWMKYAYMGKGFLDYDIVIVVSHFKGHPMGVFGGAMKNVGIGMASARGKYAVHNITHPEMGMKTWQINDDAVKQIMQMPRPNMIDRMAENCPCNAFKLEGDVLTRDNDKCGQCGYCFNNLFMGVFQFPPELTPSWPAGISDAACGFIDAIGREKMIFLNYAMDVTPACDCVSFHDRPLVPNLGVFASKDPVAVDMACIEAAESVSALPNSIADEYGFGEPNTERFTNCTSMGKVSQWAQFNAAVHNGMGDTEYVLVNSETQMGDDFLFPGATTDNPLTKQYKDIYAKISMDPGDYAYPGKIPQLPMDEQSIKPKGKVKEISVKEDK